MTDESGGTVCPFCGVGCRLDREGDRVVGRAGPANPNGRLCETGLRAFDALDADERLTQPQVRRNGDLVPVSWDTALDRAVEGFERVIETNGPDALAFLGAPRCPTETNYLLQKLARTLGTNNVDNRARGCHDATSRTLESRLGWPATTNSLDDLSEADVFLVVGANPAARQPVAFDAAVRPAVNGGATLVHVDPRANETTRLADHHLAPRPGTDPLVVSLLCALVVETGAVDGAFVDEWTTGYEQYRESLLEGDLDGDAAFAGVDPGTVEVVAEAIGDADRVAVMTGTGGDDTATADALVNLCLLTGNLGRRGTGVTILRGLANEQGAVDAGCVPDRLPGHEPVGDEDARDRLAAEWGYSPPSTPGRPESDLVSGFGDDVQGALVVGENPAVSKQDADELAAGLEALDSLVVQELAPSATTEYADVVLPAAGGVERAGTVTNLDRQVQRLQPVEEPPDGVRTDFDILSALGRRLVGSPSEYDGPGEAFAELTRVATPYSGLSYDALDERSRRWPALATAVDAEHVRADRRRSTETDEPFLYADGFATTDGRAPFAAVDLSHLSGPSMGLRLVVGDRAGSFVTADERSGDRSITVHPDDASARGIASGDRVAVTDGDASVETTARVSDEIRPGTVHLHASVADPLVRGGNSTVRLRVIE